MLDVLKDKGIIELGEELVTLRQTQLKLVMQKSSSNLDNRDLYQIRQVRRNIARIKTLLRQHNVKV